MVASIKKKPPTEYRIGDEVSYATGSGMSYGEIVRLLEGGQAIEILLEDGRREIKKSRDGAVRLLRRASGASELQEANRDRSRGIDTEIRDVMKSDIKR
jgi:hypothetical protein